MFQKNIELMLVIVLIIIFSSCSRETHIIRDIAGSYPVTNRTADINLLYDDDSLFKENLIKALITGLNNLGFDVSVDNITNEGKYDINNYKAVILLSGVAKFQTLTNAVNYIIKHNYSEKIVYFSTYTLFPIPYGGGLDEKRIDAITSASSVDGNAIETSESNIIDKLKKIIK